MIESVTEVQLSRAWVLTTQHSASSYGKPVLVHKRTNKAFGPLDVLRMDGLPYCPAWQGVKSLAEDRGLSAGQRIFVDKFLNF